MSDTTFRFELVCPEGMVLEQVVDEVLVPGSEGDFMVLAQHAPTISTLRSGILEVSSAGKESKTFYVSNGLAEVNPESLTILAQQAIPTDKISSDFFPNEIKSLEQEIEASKDADATDQLISQLDTMRSIASSLNS